MNRQLAHLKQSVGDLVAGILQCHERRRAIDADAAALYRSGRYNGVQVKVIKEIIHDLHGETASADSIWQRYAEKTGISEAAVADNLSALDKILGPA